MTKFSEKGQIIVIMPMLIALSFGALLMWGYHQNVINQFGRIRSRDSFKILDTAFVHQLRVDLASADPVFNASPHLCDTNYLNFRKSMRDFRASVGTYTSPVSSGAPPSNHCLLFDPSLLATLKTYSFTLTPDPSRDDKVNGMRWLTATLSLTPKGETKEIVSTHYLSLELESLKNYAVTFVVPQTSNYAAGFFKLNGSYAAPVLKVLGSVFANQSSASVYPNLSNDPNPWFSVTGKSFFQKVNMSNFNANSASDLKKQFPGGLFNRTTNNNVSGNGSAPLNPGWLVYNKIIPNMLTPTGAKTIGIKHCIFPDTGPLDPPSIDNWSNVTTNLTLDYSQADPAVPVAKIPTYVPARLHCDMLAAGTLTISCPPKIACVLIGHVITQQLIINAGGGPVVIISPYSPDVYSGDSSFVQMQKQKQAIVQTWLIDKARQNKIADGVSAWTWGAAYIFPFYTLPMGTAPVPVYTGTVVPEAASPGYSFLDGASNFNYTSFFTGASDVISQNVLPRVEIRQ